MYYYPVMYSGPKTNYGKEALLYDQKKFYVSKIIRKEIRIWTVMACTHFHYELCQFVKLAYQRPRHKCFPNLFVAPNRQKLRFLKQNVLKISRIDHFMESRLTTSVLLKKLQILYSEREYSHIFPYFSGSDYLPIREQQIHLEFL